ncbi:MAG: amino acid ABC transporter substrate-binding protein [Bacteroidales bacterium]|nr:amino acid ABC transporter substrate-binding protein [Bacteroidales bacterium]
MKRVSKFLIVFMFLPVFLSCNSTGTDNLKIGVMLPLTGYGSLTGDLLKKGVDLAVDSLNLNEQNIEVLFDDNKTDGLNGITVYKNFKRQGVSFYISGGAPSTMALAPLTKGNNEVLFVSAVNSKDLTNVTDRAIRLSPTGESMAAKLADFNYDSLGIRKTAVVYVNIEMGEEFYLGYKDRFVEKGGEIVASLVYDTDQRDFKDIVNKIIAASPDALYIVGVGESLSSLIRQISLNPKSNRILLTGDFNFSSPVVLKALEQYPSEVYYTDIAVDPEFKLLYEKTYNEPVSSYAAFTFSIMQIYSEVLKQTTDPTEVYAKIASHTFNCAIDSISFSEKGEPSFTIDYIKLH